MSFYAVIMQHCCSNPLKIQLLLSNHFKFFLALRCLNFRVLHTPELRQIQSNLLKSHLLKDPLFLFDPSHQIPPKKWKLPTVASCMCKINHSKMDQSIFLSFSNSFFSVISQYALVNACNICKSKLGDARKVTVKLFVPHHSSS